MPTSRATLDHFTSSAEMKPPNSAGVIRTTSAPSVSKRFSVSREASTRVRSLCNFSITGAGVPAGARMPHQLCAS